MPANGLTRFAASAFLAVTLLLPATLSALAQDDPAPQKLTLHAADGPVPGDTYTFDAAYTGKTGKPVPAPFSLVVPAQDGVTAFFNPEAESRTLYGKLTFMIGDPSDRSTLEFTENLVLSSLSVKAGDMTARLEAFAGFFTKRLQEQAGTTYPDYKYLGKRVIKAGTYDAVEVIGEYQEPGMGPMFVRMVGIPNPDGTQSVYSLSHIADRWFDLHSPDDMARTPGGTAMRQFTYLSASSEPSIKFNLFSVEGLQVSKVISINAAYGEKHNVPVKAPFSFIVPGQDGLTPLYNTATEPNAMLVKVSFATGDPKDMASMVLVENLQFIPMTLPMAERSERLENLTNLLTGTAYKAAVATYPENEYLGSRETRIGDYDAVEVIGKYIDPGLGLMYLRIVGIPNPDGTDGIFTVANVAASGFNLESVDDLALTATGIALGGFKYLNE